MYIVGCPQTLFVTATKEQIPVPPRGALCAFVCEEGAFSLHKCGHMLRCRNRRACLVKRGETKGDSNGLGKSHFHFSQLSVAPLESTSGRPAIVSRCN